MGLEAEQAKYDEALAKYVKEKVRSGGKRSSVNPTKRKVAARVNGFCTEKQQFKRVYGNLWPIALYKEKKGVNPPKQLLSTYDVGDGLRVRGILMDPSEGTPTGCYILSGVTEKGVSREATIAEAIGDEDDDKRVSEIYANAAKRTRLTVTSARARDNENQVVTCMMARQTPAREERGPGQLRR